LKSDSDVDNPTTKKKEDWNWLSNEANLS
jgi:ADP-ribosylglycohydrolase